jgi:DNA-binding NarL/FixJ family response regulator
MVRVLICDDHPIFREGLKQTLGVHPDIRVVGEAGSAAELFEALAGTACDVVVLDISLPDRSGLEVLGELRAASGPPRAGSAPHRAAGRPAKAPTAGSTPLRAGFAPPRAGFTVPAVVLLSMHSEQQYAVRAIRAGASAYIEKASVPQELVQALRKAAAGGVYISPRQAEQLALEVSGRVAVPAHGQLSERELQVLHLLGEGQPIKRIAHQLALSPSTVATYRARILTKLQLNTTAELIHYALEQGLLA